MKQKIIGIFVCTLFISTIILPVAGTLKETIGSTGIVSRGYIQGLINNASDGDTIYISSGIYYENIIINKSISLVGEDKNTTIIDGGENEDVVNVSADWVNISGFTIQNSGNNGTDSGIDIHSYYNNITGNNLKSNLAGICLRKNNNTVSDNTIIDNDVGVRIYGFNHSITINTIISNNNGIILYLFSESNNITGNTIELNEESGITLMGSDYNTISSNSITANKGVGISISYSYHGGIPPGGRTGSYFNKIQYNTISNNSYGITLYLSSFNQIIKNNILNNNKDVFFNESYLNRWAQNYWDRPRILPKLIDGILVIKGTGYPPEFIKYYPWFNVDWRPALKPYDIP